MNVKSFVNGLDPENTVKGYYDENDQLVMVEPEGSGGGGGDNIFSSFNLKVINNTASEISVADYLYSDQFADKFLQMADVGAETELEAKILAINGTANLSIIDAPAGSTVTIEGSYEPQPGATNAWHLTSDATVTVSAAAAGA